MQEIPNNLFWTQPEWIDQAHAWIKRSLAESGCSLTGPIEQIHRRIWSTVMRCSTDSGDIYFKACQPPTEPRLTVFLSGIQPENLPDLLAVDLDQGWMLMRDAGPILRTLLNSPADLVMVEPALVQYAHLQIAVSAQPEQLIRLGALDHRLERLPGLFEHLLTEPAVLRLGEEDGITADQHRQLLATLPRVAEMALRLKSSAVPQTLHHDDFHDGNIFVSGEPGQYCFVFSDWGESCITHPFSSIMLFLRSVGARAGFLDEATDAPERMPPELNRLRDAYLHPWQAYERSDRLVELFNLAWRVGMVARALTWSEFVAPLGGPARKEFTHIVPAWLKDFLLAMK